MQQIYKCIPFIWSYTLILTKKKKKLMKKHKMILFLFLLEFKSFSHP